MDRKVALMEGQSVSKCKTVIDRKGFKQISKRRSQDGTPKGRCFDVLGTFWATLGAKRCQGKRKKWRGREGKRKERKRSPRVDYVVLAYDKLRQYVRT